MKLALRRAQRPRCRVRRPCRDLAVDGRQLNQRHRICSIVSRKNRSNCSTSCSLKPTDHSAARCRCPPRRRDLRCAGQGTGIWPPGSCTAADTERDARACCPSRRFPRTRLLHQRSDPEDGCHRQQAMSATWTGPGRTSATDCPLPEPDWFPPHFARLPPRGPNGNLGSMSSSFCCGALSQVVALSGGSQGSEFTSAFGGVAEVHGRTASAASEAYDPLRTSRVQCNPLSGCKGAAYHPLTDPRKMVILQSFLGGGNRMRSDLDASARAFGRACLPGCH